MFHLLVLFLTLTLHQVFSSIPPSSLTALHDLHSSTNGPSWQYPSGEVQWNFIDEDGGGVDPCSEKWSGITCDQNSSACELTECDIIEISLSKYNLFGQLPSSLIDLSQLNYFKVEKNSLYGSIPWEYFYNMTTLSYLFLNENNFLGSLPEDINKLAHVNLLKLRENNLVGTIPYSFGEISNLGQ